jgi:hypothetical protein
MYDFALFPVLNSKKRCKNRLKYRENVASRAAPRNVPNLGQKMIYWASTQVSFNWAATDHLISSLAARLQPLGSPQASAAGAPCAVSPPSPPPALLNASRRSIPASSCRPPARPLSPDRLIPRHSPQLQSWSRGCAASLPHFPVITGGCAAAQRHRSSSGAAPPFSAQSLFSEF